VGGVTVRSPAKINLVLSVGTPRPDGFHPLATVFQAVSLFDDVTATPRDDGEFTVAVVGESAGAVPTGDDNLAVRAARALAAYHDLKDGADLLIRKTIPVAGGMAGGSTNAAAALVACGRAWGVVTPQAELAELAAGLGSDVPFCLHGHTAIGRGRGELLTEVMTRGTFHWVFAVSGEGLSTPAVYRELDRLRTARRIPARDPSVPDALLAALVSGDPAALAVALSNDLQDAALSLRPELAEVLRFGLDHGALAAQVSGSGPTCLYLAEDPTAAADLADALADSGLCATVRQAEGPVPGARALD
jgi:4-diphosphocytidyl-2-C-methyl-D-erythritol kinase